MFCGSCTRVCYVQHSECGELWLGIDTLCFLFSPIPQKTAYMLKSMPIMLRKLPFLFIYKTVKQTC